jgi:hypothetical protein
VALRRDLEPLRRGRTVTLTTTAQTWAFARATAGEAAIVLLNNTNEPVELKAPLGGLAVPAGIHADRLGGPEADVRDGLLHATLPPRSGAVYAAKLSK